MLYREDLAATKCGCPDCEEQGVFLRSRCHPDDPMWIEFDPDKGVIYTICSVCRRKFAAIVVASRKNMVVYKGLGHSEKAGGQLVVKNDDILSPAPSQKLWNHSPDGFNWGYQGSGCAQLALALLFDVTNDPELSVKLHQPFKREFVARWEEDWEITSEEIKEWITSRNTAK